MKAAADEGNGGIKMRIKLNMDQDWKLFVGDLSPRTSTEGWGGAKARAYDFGATAISLDDSGWTATDVPNDFVVSGDYTRKSAGENELQKIPAMESVDSRHFAGGCLEGKIAWYRKHFALPEGCEEKRVILYFDGIFRDSTIYLNEYLVGAHKGGYDSFWLDITDFVSFTGDNLLAVRVDASGREGWWYEGGGIYRHVALEICDTVSIAPWGVFISPAVDLKNKSAVISIKTEIASKNINAGEIQLKTEIIAPDSLSVCEAAKLLQLEAWENKNVSQEFHIEDVMLWDLDNPLLYKAVSSIYIDGRLADRCITSFGVRDIYFDAQKGFFLNGTHLKIKGVCCHHDHAVGGIAANDCIQEYRLRQLKKMGANAYRSAHHMPTQELLEMCDRIGMLVFDETRRMSSCEDDLTALRTMVKRDRNHPSVFLWGIGNEEVFSQDKSETARTTRTMKMEVKKLDPTRPVTSAVVCWNGKERFSTAQNYIPVTKNLDVMGFNYCAQAWDDYHASVPDQPVIITEASSNSGTRGCYSTNEAAAKYYIYDDDNAEKVKSGKNAVRRGIAEQEWKLCSEREYLAGIFIWTGIDYRGEPTPLGWPAVYSQFGVFDYCCFPKDNFYYYKSWWGEEDVLHIFPHWTFPGMEGRNLPVFCFSNLEEIELFVNGQSCGRQKMEKNGYLEWKDVTYFPGAVTAKGYRNGQLVLEKKITTAGVPSRIEAEIFRETQQTAEKQTIILNFSIVDEKSNIVPYADNELSFEAEGGRILGCANGNPGDHSPENIPLKRAFGGRVQLVVQADRKQTVKVRVKTAALPEQVFEVK